MKVVAGCAFGLAVRVRDDTVHPRRANRSISMPAASWSRSRLSVQPCSPNETTRLKSPNARAGAVVGAYRRYSTQYVAEETVAKVAKRGMWRGAVVAPWEWRKGKRLVGTRNSGHTAASRQGGGRCTVKGNIGKSGTRIYHVPGGQFYDRTRIDASKGERWFCTEAEARAAGWGPLAPVGHPPVSEPNRARALNPDTPGTRPTTRGLAAYNGRASERLWCRAPWRRVHRAPRESSWLLPDGQQGRPTEGRDFFRDRLRVSLLRATLGESTPGTVLREVAQNRPRASRNVTDARRLDPNRSRIPLFDDDVRDCDSVLKRLLVPPCARSI